MGAHDSILPCCTLISVLVYLSRGPFVSAVQSHPDIQRTTNDIFLR